VLGGIADLFEATSASVLTPVEPETGRFFWADFGISPEASAQYASEWVTKDAWVKAADARLLYHKGTIAIGSSYLPWEALERTEFYNEYAAPSGFKGLISAVLTDGTNAVAPRTHLSLFRRPGLPEFQSDHARLLRRMQPHLERAIEIHWALAGARTLQQAVTLTLDAVPEPVFVLRVDGLIDHANPPASRMLSNAGLLRVKQGRLMALAGSAGPLTAALRQVARGVGCALPFTDLANGRPRLGVLRLAPTRSNPSYATVWPEAVAVAVMEVRSDADIGAAFTLLAVQFMLTQAEVQVLQRVAEGHNPQMIADQLQVRVSTVRTHLQSLFDKTGLRRQADLVRLVPR
jgi:DNA-binding CsgD family transcriptional regulator/PAS domain-containing protein